MNRPKTEPDLNPIVRASDLGLVTQPPISGPPLLTTALPKRPPPKVAEWAMPDIPVEAIGRAFTAEDQPRENILRWAFQIDDADPIERKMLQTLTRALGEERAARGFAEGARLLPDQIASAWDHFLLGHPDVARDVAALRGRPAWRDLPFEKRERMPSSPLMRADKIIGVLGLRAKPPVVDMAVMLAVADAIEQHVEKRNCNPGRFLNEERLDELIGELNEAQPEIAARLHAERERVKRVLEIQARREKAAILAESGLPLRAPSSVGLAPVIQMKDDDGAEHPPEAFVPLAEAAPTDTTQRRFAIPVEELAPPPEPPEVIAPPPRAVVDDVDDVQVAAPPAAAIRSVPDRGPGVQTSGRTRTLAAAVVVALALALVAWGVWRSSQRTDDPPAMPVQTATSVTTSTGAPSMKASAAETNNPPVESSSPRVKSSARPVQTGSVIRPPQVPSAVLPVPSVVPSTGPTSNGGSSSASSGTGLGIFHN